MSELDIYEIDLWVKWMIKLHLSKSAINTTASNAQSWSAKYTNKNKEDFIHVFPGKLYLCKGSIFYSVVDDRIELTTMHYRSLRKTTRHTRDVLRNAANHSS